MSNKHTASRARKTFARKLSKAHEFVLRMKEKRVFKYYGPHAMHNELNVLVQKYRGGRQYQRQARQAKDYGWEGF